MKSETNPKTVMLKDYIIDMDSVSAKVTIDYEVCLLYTSPSPRDRG